MAKIVQNAEQGGKNQMGKYPHPVHQVLLGDRNNAIKIFRPLSEAFYNSLDHFNVRSLSNLVYAHVLLKFGTVFDDGVTLFDKIGAKAIRQVGKFEAQGIANTVLAFAKTKKQNHALFQSFGGKVASNNKLLLVFKPQVLVNTVWAFCYFKRNQSHAF
jgi:hypothetical protein